jgi:hypothetical protein
MTQVRFGSQADMSLATVNVRFVAFSGHIGLELLTSALCQQQTTERHWSRSAYGVDIGSVDPAALRSRRVGHLHPTLFASDNPEFGALCNHTDN